MTRMSAIVPLVALAVVALAGEEAAAGPAGQRKPELPSVAEAQTISSRRVPIRYPRVFSCLHAAISGLDPTLLERGLDDVLAAVGQSADASVPASDTGLGARLGLQVSDRFAVSLEAVVPVGDDDLAVRYVGGLATATLTSQHLGICALSVGAGLGRQRLATHHETYDWSLFGGSTTTRTGLESAWQTVVPLVAVLEVPNLRHARHAVVVTLRWVLGGTQAGTVAVPAAQESIPYEIDFDGWGATVGFAVGL